MALVESWLICCRQPLGSENHGILRSRASVPPDGFLFRCTTCRISTKGYIQIVVSFPFPFSFLYFLIPFVSILLIYFIRPLLISYLESSFAYNLQSTSLQIHIQIVSAPRFYTTSPCVRLCF